MIDIVGVKINADGSFDVAICSDLEVVDSIDAEVYLNDDYAAGQTAISVVNVPSSLQEGDVITLNAVPEATSWDTLAIFIEGQYQGRDGLSSDSIYSINQVDELVVGEWVWPTGYLGEGLEGCDVRNDAASEPER